MASNMANHSAERVVYGHATLLDIIMKGTNTVPGDPDPLPPLKPLPITLQEVRKHQLPPNPRLETYVAAYFEKVHVVYPVIDEQSVVKWDI
jgi:hypothetical protein